MGKIYIIKVGEINLKGGNRKLFEKMEQRGYSTDLIDKITHKNLINFIERIESRNGVHTIDAAAELGIGSKEYELIKL